MRKVLVAEGSPPMRKALELAFEQEGMQVVSAADGTHAVAMLAAERPDVLLIDDDLAGGDGVELCASIRQMPELRDATVVLLLSAFETLDADRAATAGIDDVWTKPVELRRMLPRLRELAARRTAADTDVYLERLSAALEERDRRGAAPLPPSAPRGDEASDAPVPTLSSILGETPARPADALAEEHGPHTRTAPPRERIE